MKECLTLNEVIQILQDNSAILKETEFSMQILEDKCDLDGQVPVFLAQYPPKSWNIERCSHL